LTHKLIYYYGDGLGVPGASSQKFDPEWELFDLAADPREIRNVYEEPGYGAVKAELVAELARLQADLGDRPAVG
jgi:hypothetical protein